MQPTMSTFTSADTTWITALLQTTDSFYPTGAYAHSLGLEGLVQAGVVRDAATLRTFILEQVLPAMVRTDLSLAAQAWAAVAEPADWGRLHELCLLGSAVRAAREPREATEGIGRQRLELAAGLRGGVIAEFNRRARGGGWPRPACVVAAVEGRALGAPREAVLAALVYAASANLLAAAVKLLRLGQNACQSLLTDALARTPGLVAAAVEVGEIGAFNPWWEIAAARHETAESRLFIS